MPARIIDEFTTLPITRQAKQQRRNRRNGLCPCGGSRANGGHYCALCLQRRARLAKKRKVALAAAAKTGYSSGMGKKK